MLLLWIQTCMVSIFSMKLTYAIVAKTMFENLSQKIKRNIQFVEMIVSIKISNIFIEL